MSIIVVRHGETAGNADKIIQFPDIPLNTTGIAQAGRLARRLLSHPVGAIVSSDYRRTLMTAEPFAELSGLEPDTNELLRERCFGALRGQPLVSIGDVYAQELDPPGGENWQRFHRRVDRMWLWATKLAERIDGDLLLVTHGMVCYSLALRHWGLDSEAVTTLRFGNTAVSLIDKHEKWQAGLLNCTEHLNGG